MDYVLVHGTTQSPAGWQRLTGALTRRGNRVQVVDLPTGQPGLLAAHYAVLAAGQVADTMDHPVVVAHSGGCLLLPAIAREVEARRLVWLAGYIPGPAGGPSFAGEIKAGQRDAQPGMAVADRAADSGPGRGRILLVP